MINPAETPAPSVARRRWARALDALVVLVSVALALVFATGVVRTIVPVGPVRLEARMAFGWPGRTTVHIPPFGSAAADTHTGPARLVLTVEDVDIAQVGRLIERSTAEPAADLPTVARRAGVANESVGTLLDRETRDAGSEAAALVILTALAAAAAAAVIAMAARRRWRVVGVSAVAALTLVLGSAGLGAATFRTTALAEPRLQGTLAYVPRIESLFSAKIARIDGLREQAAVVARQLAAYYADPRSIAAGGGLPGTYRVLHVSDLHLDPVGSELARSLARSYDASLVVDTGDAPILGTAEEGRLLQSLIITDTPVVYIPGNHDSPLSIELLRMLPNVTVATTGTVVADGLRIFAVPDPQAFERDIQPDRSEVAEQTDAAAAQLDAEATAGMPPPDIIALHNPSMERAFIGRAPLIVSGHTHSERLYVSDGTVRLNSGTLGGMPYDPVTTGRDRLPHSASILYYTADLPRRLIAIDRISVTPERSTTLTRHVVDESLLP